MKSPLYRHFVVLVVFCALMSNSFATVDNSVWLGTTSASWADSLNWYSDIPNNDPDNDQYYDVYIGYDNMIPDEDDITTLYTDVIVSSTYAINALNIASGYSLTMLNYGYLTISEDSYNGGTIYINDDYSNSYRNSYLAIASDLTIDGDAENIGQIVFVSGYSNSINSAAGYDFELTLGQYQTITTLDSASKGTVSADLINNGIINAYQGSIILSAIDIENNNVLKASDGGTLTVSSSTVDNTSGVITVDGSTSKVTLQNTTVTAGTINGEGIIDISGTTTLDATNGIVIDDAQVILEYGDTIKVTGDLTNNTTISLNDNSGSSYNAATFYTNGNVNLDGTGGISFDSAYQNYIRATNSTDLLTLGENQFITTSDGAIGQILVDMVNNGIVDADGGTITLSSIDVENNSILKSTDGGTLTVTSSSVDNTSGVITADSSTSKVTLQNTTITGGTINGEGIIDISGTTTLDATNGMVIDDARVTLNYSDNLRLSGDLTNNTKILLNDDSGSVYNTAAIYTKGNTSLSGTGGILFDSKYQNIISYLNATDILTLGQNQFIATSNGSNGSIYSNLINNGLVNADSGAITLNYQDKINNSTIQAINGGTLNVTGIGIDNNGTITIDETSQMNVSSASITGGTLNGEGTVNINGYVSFLADEGMTLENIAVNLGYSDTLRVQGNLTNNTTINLVDDSSSVYNACYLTTMGDVSLNGTGGILFDSEYQNIITYTSATNVLTIGQNQFIATSNGASGSVYSNLINNGLVSADGGTITLNYQDKTNNSTMQAINGGSLAVSNIEIDNNSAIIVDKTSQMTLANATITGGTVSGRGNITVSGTASLLDGSTDGALTLNDVTATISTSQTLTAKGEIINNGQISIDDPASSAYNQAYLKISGDTTISGNGSILFASEYQNIIQYSTYTDILTIGDLQTMTDEDTSSKGTINTNLINNGTMAFNGNMTIGESTAWSTFCNNCLLNILSSTTKVIGTSFTNTGTVNGNGTLNVTSTYFVNEGTLAAGNSLGSLAITGNYHQTTGTLEVEIAAVDSYDLVTISGTADLDGTLDVVLAGVTLAEGLTFDVLVADGGITTKDIALASNDAGVWHINYYTDLSTGADILQLECLIPEPAAMLILSVGLVVLRSKRKLTCK